MFYIARKTYNRPGHNLIDSDVITIRTAPAQVAGKTIVDDGDYLYFGDYAVVAHGKYETLAAARQALVDKFSAVHKIDAYAEPDVVETYNSETRLRLHHNPRLLERVHAYMRDELVESLQTRGWSKRPYSSEYIEYGMGLEDVKEGLRLSTKKEKSRHAIIDNGDTIKPGYYGIVTTIVDITGADSDARLHVSMSPKNSSDKIGAIITFGNDPKVAKRTGEYKGKTSATIKKRDGGYTLTLVGDWRAAYGGKHSGADLHTEIEFVGPSPNYSDNWAPGKHQVAIVQRVGAQTTKHVADDERLGKIIKTVETSINAIGYTIGPDALAVVLDARDIVAAQPHIAHDMPPPAHAVAPPIDVNKPPKFWPTNLSSPNRSSMSPTIGWWDGDKHDVSAQYTKRGSVLTNVTIFDAAGHAVEDGLQLTTTKSNGIHVMWDETGLVILGEHGIAVFGAHITDVRGVPRIAISSHPENASEEKGVIYDLRKGTATPWRWPSDHKGFAMGIAPDGGGGWWVLAQFKWGSHRGKRCRQHLWILNDTASPRDNWESDHYAHVTASHMLAYTDDSPKAMKQRKWDLDFWMPGVIG